MGFTGAFQAMQDQDEWSLFADSPIQFQKIVVGQLQAFAAQRQARSTPAEHRL